MKKQLSVIALLVAASLSLGGCKSNPPAPSQTPASNPAQSGTLNSDGTVTPAGQQPVATSATGQPTASATPAPQQAAPIVQAPPPPPITAPIGTRIVVRTTETLSAGRNEVGDGFSGVLSAPVVSHGATLFPRGTRVTGTVVAAKGRGRFKGAGAIGIEINTIAGMHIQTSEYEKELSGKGKRTGGFIGGGAGLGALIGGLAGGGKGAVIGGLAGAGAGTAGAAYTGNKDVVIPSESLITFRLEAPITIHR
jgi:hypothetical protein